MAKQSQAAVRHGQPQAAPRTVSPIPARESAEDVKAMRERRLLDVNYLLGEVYRTDTLDRLGNHKNGEEEIVRIENVVDNRWFVLVQFETREAYTGERGVRYVRFPKRFKVVKGEKRGPLLPLITTVIVNGKVLYVHEFAVAQLTGKRPWRTHSPRQYAMSGGEDSFLVRVLKGREDTKALATMGGVHTLFGRKLSRLFSKPGVKLSNWKIMHDPDETGNPASIAEDDTFCAGGAVHLLLVFEADPQTEALFESRALQRADTPEEERDGSYIQLLSLPDAIMRAKDQHTLTGLMLLARMAGAIDVAKIDAFVRQP